MGRHKVFWESETRSPIQAIERGLKILELFTLREPSLTLNQLTERFGMGKATTHRYAMALRGVGALAV